MIQPSLHPGTVRAACQPRRRFALALTPRAIGLLCAGFLLLVPGFFIPKLSYTMLLWDGLVLLAFVLDLLRLPSPKLLVIERNWLGAPSLDSASEIELAVENQGAVILDCVLTDDLPAALAEKPGSARIRAFPRVAGEARYSVTPRQRGDWQAGSVYVRYRSPLGLAEKWATAPLAQTFRVYPALRMSEEQQIFLARSRQIDLQLRLARQRGLGRDFESLREYRNGDDLRDVCWTASARRGALITRQYQTERSQPVWIVLDCGRLMRARVGQSRDGWKQTKLDYACSTAVALAQLALYSGDRVGLLTYGQGIQQRLLPGRGAPHLRQMIELLAQARAETSEADHLRATAMLNRLQPRRSMVLWVTDLAETAMRPEVVDGAAQLLRRHLLLFVAMAQPEVVALSNEWPANVETMFRAAAAQEMAGRRELLLARLQEQGALTLDLDPEKLTSSVLNQYLKVKERAMI